MFWTYMLRCADGSYYTGHTDDLERRVAAHISGQYDGYSASRLPVELVWQENFPSRMEALEAERKIKGWSRDKKEGLIRGDRAAIQRLTPRQQSFETESRTTPSALSQRIPSPIVVLVRPQLGENIGKAARAMLNFGLTEMRLITPRDGWPNPAAGPAAAGADTVLDNARVFNTLADAVADCAHVYATTVRKRGMTKPVVTPDVAAREMRENPGRSAIVFGPERSGLETQDVALARKILTVPINPEFGSLNLAQAVMLCVYEWSKQVQLALPTEEDLLPPAPQAELEGLIAHFGRMLEAKNYFWPETRAEANRRTLRNVLTRPGWNSLEVRTLRGVLSTLEREPRKRGS